MDNQHQRIKGYRDLSEADIALMNEIKAKAAEFEKLLEKVGLHNAEQYNATNILTPKDAAAQAEYDRLQMAQPHRWRAIAQTHFQEGCMALTRAVAQPGSF